MFVFGPVCVCVGFRVCVFVYVYFVSFFITPVFMHAFANASVCTDAICFRVHNGDNDDDDINSDDDNENVESMKNQNADTENSMQFSFW